MKLLVAFLLVLATLVPVAAANPFPPTYPACVRGVTAAQCFDNKDVCSPYASLQRPACVDLPCYPIDCISVQQSSTPVPPYYPPCVAGVAHGCPNGADACTGSIGNMAPRCFDVPCYNPVDCIAVQSPGALQCSELISPAGVIVWCHVDGKDIVIPAACDTCYPAFWVVCTEGTEGVGCQSYPNAVVADSNVKPYCIEGQPGCPAGELVCTLTSPQVCVPDPCYTTQCF